MLALTLLCISFLFSYVHATPLMMRDVFSPHITSPNEDTVWPVGTQQTVTWETDNIPPDSQLTDPNGKVVLGHLGPTGGLNLDLDHPLAQNFKLRVGHVQVTVPSVPPRDDYIIVLFGDSGNTSPTFAITRITNESNSTTSTTKASASATPTTIISTQDSSSSGSSTSKLTTESTPLAGTTTTGSESSTHTPTATLLVPSTTSTTPAVSTQTAPISSSSSSLTSPTSSSATNAADTAAPTSNSAWVSHRLSTIQTQLSSIGVVCLLLSLLV